VSHIFRIGEFSKLTQVSIRMLRYYDETGLLKPAQIDKFTGYRNYSVEQIHVLQKIIMLRDLGYSVSEIAVAISNWNDDFLSAHLKNKRLEIEDAIKKENEKLSKIDAALSNIGKDEMFNQYNFMLKQVPTYSVISLRRIIPNYFCEGRLWKELFSFIEDKKIVTVANIDNFAVYHDKDYKEENVDVEVCIAVSCLGKSVDEFSFRQTEKVDLMACAMVYGPFDNISEAYLSFVQWLSEHTGYNMQGANRQICRRGPWNEESSDKYLTEIQIPLEKN
jgi:DNA-binding transcriptional MerR regulator